MKKIIRKTSKPNISTPTPVEDIKEDINVVEYSKNLGRPALKEVNHKEETENIHNEIKLNINKRTDSYVAPSLSLLKSPIINQNANDKKEILNNAKIIEETMSNFGIDAKVVEINVGPTITCYELQPSPELNLVGLFPYLTILL